MSSCDNVGYPPGRRAALCLAMILVLLTAGVAHDVHARGVPSTARSAANISSIAFALTPEGRLPSGVHGVFRADGWRLACDPSGSPRFLPPGHGQLELPRSSSAAVDEDGGWDGRFGPPGGTLGGIYAIAVDGEEIFVGGDFRRIGNLPVNGAARWDGNRWHPLGSGVDGMIWTFALVGQKLYAGGQFTQAGGLIAPNFALWNRATSSWQTVGKGVSGDDDAMVSTILVHGSELYVSGKFNAAGNTIANNIARFDGTRFYRLGVGTLGPAWALASHGGYIYVGGGFESAGNVKARGLARYNPVTGGWEAVGTGVDGSVYAIAGDGNDLYIGGGFDEAGGRAAANIVRWNTVSGQWSAVSTGFTTPDPRPVVRAITVDGDNVYMAVFERISSLFESKETLAIRAMARYHKPTNTISTFAENMNTRANETPIVTTILKVGRHLYVGGLYHAVERIIANGLSRYDLDTGQWRVFGEGLSGRATAIARWNGGLYVAGDLLFGGNADLSRVGSWRDGVWSTVQGGIDGGTVLALHATGKGLVAAGNFTKAGGVPASGIAEWTGSAWQTFGRGLTAPGSSIATISSIGSDLYVGGRLSEVDGVPAIGIARWDGQSWSSVGGGVWKASPEGDTIGYGVVQLLHADADRLYVSGDFNSVGGRAAEGFAIWNARTGEWEIPVSVPDGPIYAMTLHRGRLIVAGTFESVGTLRTRVAAYDPVDGSWSSLVTELDERTRVTSLASDGRYLYVGGNFLQLDEKVIANLGKWDGVEWSPLGSGPDSLVLAMTADTAGVFIAGTFSQTGPMLANGLGHWTPTPLATTAVRMDDAVAGGFVTGIRPNPVAEAATISFALRTASHVSVEIFSPAGTRVARLADATMEPGAHSLIWHPDGAPSGVYLCRMIVDDRVETRTVVVGR